MEVTDYCKNLTMELTSWKAKMYDLGRKLDKVSTGDKEKVVPEVNELHMIIEELEQRIETLQKECPTKWDPSAIEDKIDDLRIKLDETWDSVSPSDIGG